MANIKGIDVLISINTGTAEAPSYVQIAGQRGGTLNRSAETLEATTKDSGGFKEFEYGFFEWSVETEGLIVINDAGFQSLEDAFMNSEKVKIQIAMPSGGKYEGLAVITDMPTEYAYDDLATWSVTFQGTGILAKTEA